MTVYASVIDLIGNTPIVDVSNLSPKPSVRILAKIESGNPAGSVKDRIARKMIEEAEADGTLTPGRTIIEPSSGNTGIALAMIARLKGYPIKIVLPENVSVERRQLLEIFGAEIILSPGAEGSNGAVRRAQQLAEEHPDWAFLYQYANEANPRAHYETTGPEIWSATEGKVTHFLAGIGTSGTLMGTGRYLKDQNPDVEVYAVEPDDPMHGLEGLKHMGTAKVPGIYEPSWLDGVLPAATEAAYDAVVRLARQGILVGASSGGAMVAAERLARELDEGVIVIVFPDGGGRYLSTGLYG